MRIFISCIFLFISSTIIGQDGPDNLKSAPFLSIKANSGDQVSTIMELYDLARFECNTTQFLKLNGLKTSTTRLVSGKTYKMPIQTMHYNGKSIRTTAGIESWTLAVQIRDYNQSLLKKGVREDDFTESRDLWIPWHLINCDTKGKAKATEIEEPNPKPGKKVIPATVFGGEPSEKGKPRNFPIFGETYSKTPIISSKLKGRVFYLISGHGGPDPGARGKRAKVTLCEDEYAYDVTLRLLRYLLSHGATAYMIVRDLNDGIRDDNYLKCDKDEVVWGNKAIPVNQKARLGQRTDIVNSLTAAHNKRKETDQTVIEIHVDSRSVATETDVFFYYRPNDESSMALALNMHQIFLEKYNQKRGPARRYTGTVTARDLFTLRETHTPRAVYIELANIQNDWDQQRIVIKNNRQALANWIGAAVSKR